MSKIRITWKRAQALRDIQGGLCGTVIDRAVELLGWTPGPRSWTTLERLLDVGVSIADVTMILVAVRPDLGRLFACDCAERTLQSEKNAGREPDPRSWAAINVARRYAVGDASVDALIEAAVAAYTAAANAAYVTFYTVGITAASSAADAAYAAAAAASKTAITTFSAIVVAAANDTAEKSWQRDQLLRYLRGEK